MLPGSSDHTTACGSKMARRPPSWVWNVVTVSSASVLVSTRPPRSTQVLPRVQLRAAGQAGDRAQHLLAAPGGRLGATMYS